jgi:hypothetical protein
MSSTIYFVAGASRSVLLLRQAPGSPVLTTCTPCCISPPPQRHRTRNRPAALAPARRPRRRRRAQPFGLERPPGARRQERWQGRDGRARRDRRGFDRRASSPSFCSCVWPGSVLTLRLVCRPPSRRRARSPSFRPTPTRSTSCSSLPVSARPAAKASCNRRRPRCRRT